MEGLVLKILIVVQLEVDVGVHLHCRLMVKYANTGLKRLFLVTISLLVMQHNQRIHGPTTNRIDGCIVRSK